MFLAHIDIFCQTLAPTTHCLLQHPSKTYKWASALGLTAKGHRHTSQKLYRKHGKKQILCLPPWSVRQ